MVGVMLLDESEDGKELVFSVASPIPIERQFMPRQRCEVQENTAEEEGLLLWSMSAA